VVVESIKVPTEPVVNLPAILRCWNSKSDNPQHDVITIIMRPIEVSQLKFYFDPSDSSKVYSESFPVKLYFRSSLYGIFLIPRQLEAISKLSISATVTGRDENDVPILGDLKIVNLGWSSAVECGITCRLDTACKMLVGLDSGEENPTGKPFFALDVQYRPTNTDKYENGTLNLGYTTYSNVLKPSYEPPTIPPSSKLIPQVVLSIMKQQ